MTKAQKIVKAILHNLSDRSGIGNELDMIDDDVREEMVADLVAIVEKELAKS